MGNPQQAISESRPMLEEFLGDIGIHQHGQPIADEQLLNHFSEWLSSQAIPEDDFWYVVSRVAAFICEYLIDGYSAVRFIKGERIFLRLPIESSHSSDREFDPYSTAAGLVREKRSLKHFLHSLCN